MEIKEIYDQIDIMKNKNETYDLGCKPEQFELIKKRCEKFHTDISKIKNEISEIKAMVGIFNHRGVIIEKRYNSYCIQLTNPEEELKDLKDDSYGMLFIKKVGLNYKLTDEEWQHLPLLIGLLENQGYRYSDESKQETIIKSTKQVKEELIKRKEITQNISEEQVKSLLWLFGKEFKDITSPEDYTSKQIIAVIEENNKRLYILKDYNSYQLKRCMAGSTEYNYIDEGRVIYESCLYLTDEVVKNGYKKEVLSKIMSDYRVSRYNSESFMIVDTDIYNKHLKRMNLEEKKEKENESMNEILKQQMTEKVNNLNKGSFKFQEIEFSKNYIEYQGQKIGGKKVNMDKFINSKIDFGKALDFNEIYADFVDVLFEQWQIYAESNFVFVMGNINVKLGFEQKETKSGSFTRFLVNGIRINKDERKEVLNRAICYEKVSDYNDFLNAVSKCSLRFHKYLENGLRITFRDNLIGNDEMTIKLKIIREKNHNFIELPNKKVIPAKDSNQLFKFGSDERSKMYHTYEELYRFFKNKYEMDDSDISNLIKEGIKDYKNAIKRSEELLKNTVKQFKCKNGQLEINNSTHYGYEIKGVSGNKYFVSEFVGSVPSKHDVYNINNPESPQHICIVDKTIGADIGKDKLVSRIMALANDSYVLSHIYTLKI